MKTLRDRASCAYAPHMQGSAPLYLRESLVKQANTTNIRSTTKDLSQIPHTNLKRFDDRASFAYAPNMQGSAPLYLRESLVKQANTRTIRSNTGNLSHIPHNNLKRFDDRAFCAYAPFGIKSPRQHQGCL